MSSTPRILQGVFPFEGRGLANPTPVGEPLRYHVPADRRAQLVYFRGGNSATQIACALLARNGVPMRRFPIGAQNGCHVSLAVIEDLLPDTELELLVSAPEGVVGELIVDIGIVEFPDDGLE